MRHPIRAKRLRACHSAIYFGLLAEQLAGELVAGEIEIAGDVGKNLRERADFDLRVVRNCYVMFGASAF